MVNTVIIYFLIIILIVMAPGRLRDKIIAFMRVCEPYSASEIARGAGTTARTVIRDLEDLLRKRPDFVGHKKIGRIRIFWLKSEH